MNAIIQEYRRDLKQTRTQFLGRLAKQYKNKPIAYPLSKADMKIVQKLVTEYLGVRELIGFEPANQDGQFYIGVGDVIDGGTFVSAVKDVLTAITGRKWKGEVTHGGPGELGLWFTPVGAKSRSKARPAKKRGTTKAGKKAAPRKRAPSKSRTPAKRAKRGKSVK